MNRYDLEQLQVTWLDSFLVAQQAWPERKGNRGHGLKSLASDLGIEFQHHDALEDARAVAHIMLKACHEVGTDIQGWLQRLAHRRLPSSSGPTRSLRGDGDIAGPLSGEVAVFTGHLSISQSEAADLAQRAGCAVTNSVSRKVTMLVVGTQNKAVLKGYEKSRKHRDAEKLKEEGASIQILSENDFRELMQLDSGEH